MWRQGRRQGRKTRRVAYFSAAERRKDEDSISRSKKRQKAEQWGKTGIRRRGLASRYQARQVEVDDAKKNNCWQINRQGGAGQLPNRLCSCQLDAFLAGTRTCSFDLNRSELNTGSLNYTRGFVGKTVLLAPFFSKIHDLAQWDLRVGNSRSAEAHYFTDDIMQSLFMWSRIVRG
jgi:hypothetical protein